MALSLLVAHRQVWTTSHLLYRPIRIDDKRYRCIADDTALQEHPEIEYDNYCFLLKAPLFAAFSAWN